MAFPIQRLRRLRQREGFRRMVRETSLAPSDFIYPLFVVEGRGRSEEIVSMPGQFRRSVDLLIKEAGEIFGLGIPAVILFGVPDRKDERGVPDSIPTESCNGRSERSRTRCRIWSL